MATAIDTNILVAFWTSEDRTNTALEQALDSASAEGGLVICGAVFAELLAAPQATEDFILEFCSDAGISIDWSTDEAIWKAAGQAYRHYAKNRRRNKAGQPRRILTDFIIGAHAAENGHSLLTLDKKIYRSAFPKLTFLDI